MPTNEKDAQEKHSLRAVKDPFKKIIIVKDVVRAQYDDTGILRIGLFDFLLDENSIM